MIIQIKVTDSHAKLIKYYLARRYKTRSTVKVETLCRIAILAEVAESAKDELKGLK